MTFFELDVVSQSSIDAAINHVVGTRGRIDVIVRNAGHVTFGPSEAFTAEQLGVARHPTLGPYFAAKAAMDSLAVTYAGEVARWGIEPEDPDPTDVARAIVKLVDLPHGKRPFRVHIDPSQDGTEIVNGMADRVRRELLRRIGLLSPTHSIQHG